MSKKKTRRVITKDNILFVQNLEMKRGKDRVWRQRGINESELPWFRDMDMEYYAPDTKDHRQFDLEIYKERYND
jgi:hypothetical protein